MKMTDPAKGVPHVEVVGDSSLALFGMSSAEHLRRQFAQAWAQFVKTQVDQGAEELPENLVLVALADVTASNVTLQWLLDRPDHFLTDASGRALMAVVSGDRLAKAISLMGTSPGDAISSTASGACEIFVRKLRRRAPIEAMNLRRTPRVQVERRLFDLAYKDVTDVVTRYAWPWPAFQVVRACTALKISPNAVTISGIVLMLVASKYFFEGAWGIGLLAAWTMTFFDTVDGKLARTTGTSSRLGDVLDHRTDEIHPPIWWTCIAVGASPGLDPSNLPSVVSSCFVVLAAYGIGRYYETTFKRRFGFNQFLWRPADRLLRLFIARRNINLLILTAGAALGLVLESFHAMAVWSALSIGTQVVRYYQAVAAERRGESIVNWMSESPFHAAGRAISVADAHGPGEKAKALNPVRD